MELIEGENVRYCLHCNKLQTFDQFRKREKGKYGYGAKCKTCSTPEIAKRQKEYRKKNRKQLLEYSKKYYKENKDYWKEYYKKYNKERRKNDIEFRIMDSIRSRIYNALKGKYKTDSTKNLIGCSIENFKYHLKNQFEDEMTWDNYGEWHIDHIRPCASFDLTDPEQQKECFHYSNCQPLWAEDNLKKNDKILDNEE